MYVCLYAMQAVLQVVARALSLEWTNETKWTKRADERGRYTQNTQAQKVPTALSPAGEYFFNISGRRIHTARPNIWAPLHGSAPIRPFFFFFFFFLLLST